MIHDFKFKNESINVSKFYGVKLFFRTALNSNFKITSDITIYVTQIDMFD